MSPLEPLPAAEAHLWHLDPDALDEAVLARCRELMCEEERQRERRLRIAVGKRLHVAARGLVRSRLSLYTGVEPRDWRFAAGPHGRPELIAPRGYEWLRFNLSHTRGRVACLLARGAEVGVDVENIEREGSLLDVAERYFSAREVAELASLPGPDRLPRFFDYWTLKESYIKARGLGLALPLGQFSFLLGRPGPLRVAFDPALVDDPESWQFEQVAWPPRHQAAVAIRCGRGARRRLVVRALAAPA